MEEKREEEFIYSDDINKNAITEEERGEDAKEDDAINDTNKVMAESDGETEDDPSPRSNLEGAEDEEGSRLPTVSTAEPGELAIISSNTANDELLEEESLGPAIKYSRSTRIDPKLYFKVSKSEKESGDGPGEA